MATLRKIAKSFYHAMGGIVYAIRRERNFRVHVAVMLIVVVLMFVFDMTALEYVALIVMIALVLSLELVNTVVEKIIDILKPRINPYAKIIKDMMAGAVLVVAVAAIAVGVLIFWPYFRDFII